MKIIDKFFLVILLLVLLALSVFGLCVMLGFIGLAPISAFLTLMTSYIVNVVIGCAVCALLLILTFRVMIAAFRGPAKTQPAPSSILINSGEFGALHITVAALDAMVQRYCHANSKIRECYSAIMPTATGVSIKLRVSVVNDVNLPEFTQALQSGLKEQLEELSGLKVLDIDVLIVPIVNAAK